MHHLFMASSIRMKRISPEAATPAALSVVDCAEEVYAGNVPGVDQEIHTAGKAVLPLGKVQPCIGQSYDRSHTRRADPGNQLLQATGESLEDCLGLSRRSRTTLGLAQLALSYAVIAERQANDNIVGIDHRKVSCRSIRRVAGLKSRLDGGCVVTRMGLVEDLPAALLKQFLQPSRISTFPEFIARSVRS